MNILALDLGTKTGWAALVNGAQTSGVWKLATPKELKTQKSDRLDRRNDMRIWRLFTKVAIFCKENSIQWLFFEDVLFLSTQIQSQLWASLRAAVWLNGQEGIQIDCVPVGTLKKFATGHGNATKEQMIAAIPDNEGKCDNECDALHLLHFARKKLEV